MNTPAKDLRAAMKSLDMDIEVVSKLLGVSAETIACNLITNPTNPDSCGYQLVLRWVKELNAIRKLVINPGPSPKPLTLED